MMKLWVIDGDNRTAYELTTDILTIGRTHANTIRIDDPMVSQSHAHIVPKSDGVYIEDLGSRNGTFVNSNKIKSWRLEVGDRVRIGTARMNLEADSVVDQPNAKSDNAKSIMATLGVIPPGFLEQLNGGELDEESCQPEALADTKLRLIQLIGESLIQTMEVEKLAESILAIVVEQTGADRGFLCLFEEDGAQTVLATHGLAPGEPPRTSRAVTQRVLDERAGVLINNVVDADDSLNTMSVVSTVCVPLWFSDKIMGFLSLDSKDEHHRFHEADLELLVAVAHQSAIGIERSRLAKAAEKKQDILSYLSKYLDENILRQVTDRTQREDPLAPTVREVTVLFSDIVSFTKISEGLAPIELANFVHEYLTAMTETIFAHGGTIDKYIGDAVMALFGAPIASEDAAAAAVCAALEMRERVKNMKSPASDGHPLRVRFGISSGSAVVGNIGSAQRTEYTAIGDSVNVASRLQAFARPNEICIDEPTRRQAGEGFAVQEIGTVDVKNRSLPIEVYKVLGTMEGFEPVMRKTVATSMDGESAL